MPPQQQQQYPMPYPVQYQQQQYLPVQQQYSVQYQQQPEQFSVYSGGSGSSSESNHVQFSLGDDWSYSAR